MYPTRMNYMSQRIMSLFHMESSSPTATNSGRVLGNLILNLIHLCDI